MAKILIVDDHVPFRAVFAETLIGLNYEVMEAGSGAEALQELKRCTPQIIFLDLRLPDMSGLEVFQRVKDLPACKNVPVIILTAYADSKNTIAAISMGAFDHMTKPVTREGLKDVLKRAMENNSQNQELIGLNTKSAKANVTESVPHACDDELIGVSAALREVEKTVGCVLAIDTAILLIGETGTGKETIARIIHNGGKKNTLPFGVVSCSNPSSEFSNWQQHGTIFLDEIGDLETSSQIQLLHLLRDDNSGPRIISGTRYDPTRLIKEKNLREDLFYRLSAFPILIPPLRDRNSDILVLAENFIVKHSGETLRKLTPSASKALLEYHWPGNVRELENVIQRACIVTRGISIDHQDLVFANILTSPDASLTDVLQLDYYSAIARVEKMLLAKALNNSDGNRAEAARSLGINRQLLYAKIKEHGLE